MKKAFFVSDLHGSKNRYEKLFSKIETDTPELLFIGGDILPHLRITDHEEFIKSFLLPEFSKLKTKLGDKYPAVYLILGNDDPRSSEYLIAEATESNYWHYMHQRKIQHGAFTIYGYAYIPPTPFLLKDWERYDVSRFVDPGCIHPIDGIRTVDPDEDIEYATIKDHLDEMTKDDDLSKAVFLFHSPPYQTKLDRAALDGKSFDHVPLDVHVGSIAIRRFIEKRQPLLTLHGHIHESTEITGSWKDTIGETLMFNAAHHGQDLSLIEFYLDN